MRLLITGNCQTTGIAYFLRRALPHFEIRDLPHLGTFFGHITEEKITEDHAWADLVFFHHKHDGQQDYPTKAPKIPLSVWFQSAPFMAQVPGEIWDKLKESGADIEWIVKEADLDYEERWAGCWERMKEKEENEGVPSIIRMSEYMRIWGRSRQLQLTCNHPTSYVFWDWAMKIAIYLGEDIERFWNMWCEVEANPNLAGLPCEESATTGARKHLGLQWGGRPEDDASGRLIATERLK